MLRVIDDFIFDRFPSFQWLTEVIEYYTGINHIKAGLILLFVGCGACMVLMFNAYIESPSLPELIVIIWTGIVVFFSIVSSELSGGTTDSAARNYMRVSDLHMVLRLLDVLVSGVGIYIWIDGGYWVYAAAFLSITCYSYMSACDRLPPSERFWLKKTARV